jgi:gentisate 1,2-dioxygenase
MSKKISTNDTVRFDQEGFSGNTYVKSEEQVGFNALLVTVHGSHPRKQILSGNTRCYFVIKGSGMFTLDDTQHQVTEGDFFLIDQGGEYEYMGDMSLFEFNISPENSFGDKRV